MEIRIKDVNLQCDSNDESLEIAGYINVTERESEVLYSKRDRKCFKEVMKRGVFQRAIEKARTIPLLLEHNWDKQLATTSDSSLELKEDNVGLKFRAKIFDKEVYRAVKDGLINACSFGFKPLDQEVVEISSNLEKRFVNSIDLMEVSLVKNPAYVGSICETRSANEEELKALDLDNSVDEAVEEVKEEIAEVSVEEERAKEKITDEEDAKKDAEKDDAEDKDEDVEDSDKKEDPEKDDEDSEEKTDDDSEKDEEEDHKKRNLEAPGVIPGEDATITKDQVKEIVDSLIDEKLQQISNAENVSMEAQEYLEEVKEYNQQFENEIVNDCMRNNAEVVRLRLELLKLQNLKKGI